jgi:hypothetical protein
VSSIFLSGAPAGRVPPAHDEGLYRDFINRPVLYNPYRHISDQFLALVDAIESTSVPKISLNPVRTSLAAPRLRLKEGAGGDAEEASSRFPRWPENSC